MPRRPLVRLGAAIALIAAGTAAPPAAALDTGAPAAIVVDMASGAVLMEKDADAPLPPASMSKLMTLFMVFEALEEGRLSLDDEMEVSEKAWRMGGSKMFVEVGDRVRVRDLILGVTVQSGNDACIVLAEGLAGTEEAFARRMNERAAEIGLTNSHFVNATGWPEDGHVMSVRDRATLAARIVREFPEQYRYFSVREFTWSGITQGNRNPLLYLDVGADGLKTGHTEEAGYGLVASAMRDGRRVFVVVAGLDSVQDRRIEAARLIDWAFREFRSGLLFENGRRIAEAEVWLGEKDRVGLAPLGDVRATVPVAAADDLRVSVRYDGPVTAPIALGETVAELVIEAPGIEPIRHPLVAAETVGEGGILTRVAAAARGLVLGSGPPEADPEPAVE